MSVLRSLMHGGTFVPLLETHEAGQVTNSRQRQYIDGVGNRGLVERSGTWHSTTMQLEPVASHS
ncbi:hypothetical protein SAMD00023353_0501360 [Rosellinia necatrix]|uniref:Uncharacterized protein n=1 Tax=Rosellinia necatrix TaxID=77044 RepID=A0A1S8A5M7_ROSNE|nr:hypothetical protein SAMD00023353_0501360 [Rosellinia necatrix]